jgi:hypothetical protein
VLGTLVDEAIGGYDRIRGVDPSEVGVDGLLLRALRG